MKKQGHPSCYMQELAWADVRQDVANVNAKLASIIDDLSPDSSLTLFKSVYPYGSTIIKQGILQIPCHHDTLIPITDASVSNTLREKLGYNQFTNPVSIVLQNTLEIFFILGGHTIPLYGLIPPGKIFSTWRVLSDKPHAPAFLWDMTSGARSLVMLPKISNAKYHKRLHKKLHIKANIPKTLVDQWQVFKEIGNHPRLGPSWQSCLLFFSKAWFDHLDDKAWHEFHRYLLDTAWQGSEYWRNQFIWDGVFSVIKQNQQLKPNPYIEDTVKTLLGVAVGAVPAFQPATDDTGAPIKAIQKAYTDYYKLEDYAPIIMQPAFFQPGEPVYYSLKYPTTTSFSPKSNSLSSMISDLYDTKWLLDKYIDGITSKSLHVEDTPIFDTVQQLHCSFFHPNTTTYHFIKDPSVIAQEDKRFMKKLKGRFPHRCDFFNGVIKIGLESMA